MRPALLIAFLLAASQASAQQPDLPRFRSGAEVIAIDVTVIDKQGLPVGDLTADDFTINVEGKPRAIQSVQFMRSAKTDGRAPRPDESTNADAASGRLTLIVVDDSMRPDAHGVVAAAGSVLANLGPGDLAAVARIPDGGGVPFTADRAKIAAELTRVVSSKSRRFRSDNNIYISEALDFDGPQRLQWPAALVRECGVAGDNPVYRLCAMNLEGMARQLLIDETIRTNDTIRSLERLMKNLEPTRQPVTIVLIAETMVIARDPAALAGLAAACASARVTLHVVQPPPPVVAMTDSGLPADPQYDRMLNAEGLEQMAALAQGQFYRAVSDGSSAFERISREVAGYYLLGIEPDPEDRRHPRRRVEVRVKRPGVTVRARSMFALEGKPVDTTTDTAARLRSMLDTPVAVNGVTIRIAARTIAGTGDQMRILVAAELGEPTDQQARYHVGLIAIDAEGKVKSRTAATTWLPPARNGVQSPSLFTTSLLVDEGDYSLRLAVIDEDGRSGSVHHNVHAAMREWPRGLRTSDLIVANRPAAGEFPPFNASSIVSSDAVAAVIDVSHDDLQQLNGITVRFEIDGERVEAGAPPADRNDKNPRRSFASLLALEKAGEHRLVATISAPGREPITIERAFSYAPIVTDPLAPSVTRGFIEMLEGQLPVSAALASFVAGAKNGRFAAPPDADTRPDGDVAMVTFIGGLAAMRDNKPALARALLQQTLRKAPAFEGATYYLSLLPPR